MSTALTVQSHPASVSTLIASRGDTAEFHRLTSKIREMIMHKIHAMLLIDQLLVEGMGRMEAYRQAGQRFHRRGLTAKTISSIYPLWERGGRKRDTRGQPTGPVYEARDWRMFAPNWNNGNKAAISGNPEFIGYVVNMVGESTRPDTVQAIYQRMKDDWFEGRPVPGVGDKYSWAAERGRAVPMGPLRRNRDMPVGLSYSNIWRIVSEEIGRRKSAARMLTQRGEFAAHDHWGDQLLRDRSKLMPLQMITFDDVIFDIKVWMYVNGKPQIVRPAALFALDVGTGTILSKGVAPAYMRESDGDGGQAGSRRGLQQADMRMLVLSILESYGLPQDWQMNLLLENAAASLSGEDKLAFERTFGGQIRIETTGRIRSSLLKSGFVEQGGMPWMKGWIEAFFRLLHTRINHLPATIGRRYDLTRGEVGDEKKADSQIHYVLRTLQEAVEKGIDPKELDLSSIMLSYDQFEELLDQFVTRLNWRTQHNLQGFQRVPEAEYMPGEWMRLDDPRAGQLVSYSTEIVERMEAPLERMTRLARGHRFTHPHPAEMRMLYMDRRTITIRSEQIRLSLRDISPDDQIFRDIANAAWLREYNGREKAVMVHVSPDGSQVHCFDAREQHYLGSVANVRRVDITDDHAMGVRMGEVHRGRQSIRDEVAAQLQPREDRLAQARAHNREVLAQPSQAAVVAAAQTIDQAQRAKRKKISQIAQSDDLSDLAEENIEAPAEEDFDDFSAEGLI